MFPLAGGPATIDMWDNKPNAPEGSAASSRISTRRFPAFSSPRPSRRWPWPTRLLSSVRWLTRFLARRRHRVDDNRQQADRCSSVPGCCQCQTACGQGCSTPFRIPQRQVGGIGTGGTTRSVKRAPAATATMEVAAARCGSRHFLPPTLLDQLISATSCSRVRRLEESRLCRPR
jgi:hypothetical protein